MRALGILLRKELHATFTSPIAWVVSAVFLLVAGYTFSLSLLKLCTLSDTARLTVSAVLETTRRRVSGMVSGESSVIE